MMQFCLFGFRFPVVEVSCIQLLTICNNFFFFLENRFFKTDLIGHVQKKKDNQSEWIKATGQQCNEQGLVPSKLANFLIF